MAIQFPANPQVGDPPFTDPTSGESWVWDGTKWNLQGGGGGDPFPPQIEVDPAGPEPSISIDADGNLGVGTATPDSQLHVEVHSDQAFLVTATGINQGVWSRYRSAAPNNAELSVGTDGAAGGSFGVDGGAVVWSHGTGPLAFGTNNTERMQIQGSGRVRISSTGHGMGVHTAGTTFNIFEGFSNGTEGEYDGNVQFIVRPNGDIQNTNASAPGPIGSERRIKTKIGSFDHGEAWSVVKAAEPRQYEMKAFPGIPCYGYIVDELEKVDKKLILPGTTEDEKGPIRTYDSNKLAFMYRVALKEALERIEALEARLTKLEGGATKATTRRTTRK